MKALFHFLPPDLCFPKPPFRIDGRFAEVGRDAVSSYLAAIRSWRLRALEVLRNAEEKELSEIHDLSRKAQQVFASFLASGWSPGMTAYAAQSPYNLRAFPPDVLAHQSDLSLQSVLEILRWRAGVVDYLSDAPFALLPALDLYECTAIGRFLDPNDHKKLCGFCLTEFSPEQMHPDAHECALISYVRAKWPQTPSVFRTWARKPKDPS